MFRRVYLPCRKILEQKICVNCDHMLTKFLAYFPLLHIFISHYPTCSLGTLGNCKFISHYCVTTNSQSLYQKISVS